MIGMLKDDNDYDAVVSVATSEYYKHKHKHIPYQRSMTPEIYLLHRDEWEFTRFAPKHS